MRTRPLNMPYLSFPHEFAKNIWNNKLYKPYNVSDITIVESLNNNVAGGFPLDQLPEHIMERIIRYAFSYKHIQMYIDCGEYMTLSKSWLFYLNITHMVHKCVQLIQDPYVTIPLKYWYCPKQRELQNYNMVRDLNYLPQSLERANMCDDVTKVPAYYDYYIIFYQNKRYIIVKKDIIISDTLSSNA